jgi:hypothetical protein
MRAREAHPTVTHRDKSGKKIVITEAELQLGFVASHPDRWVTGRQKQNL